MKPAAGPLPWSWRWAWPAQGRRAALWALLAIALAGLGEPVESAQNWTEISRGGGGGVKTSLGTFDHDAPSWGHPGIRITGCRQMHGCDMSASTMFSSPPPATSSQSAELSDTSDTIVFAAADAAHTGAVIEVDGVEDLAAALAAAQGGEVIRLAAGNYGELELGGRGLPAEFDIPVTLVAAEPGAVQLTGLHINKAQNLVLDGFALDYDYEPGDALGEVLAWVRNSSDVTLRNCTFTGDNRVSDDPAQDGAPTGYALRIRDSDGVTVENCEMTTFWKGLHVLKSQDVQISGNRINDFRTDALNLVDVQNVVVENNYVHDPRRAYGTGDHPDMLQMWTVTDDPAEVSRDILIRGNVMDIGEGGWAQGINISNKPVDDHDAGDAFLLRNIEISDNVLINGHVNGIRVGSTDGLTLRNNTLLFQKDMADPEALERPAQDSIAIVLAEGSRNVTIADNITPRLVGYSGQPDWTETGTTAPPPEEGTGLLIDEMRNDNFGEAWDEGSAGFSVDLLTPSGQVAFDASGSVDGGAAGIDPATQFLWDFGDGTFGEGLAPDHVYAEAGRYIVTLRMVAPDGTEYAVEDLVEVAGTDVLHFDAASGQVVATAYGEATPHALDDLATLDDGQQALWLGPEPVEIGAETLATLDGSEALRLAFSLRAAGDDPAGQLIDLGGLLTLTVTPQGELRLEIATDTTDLVSLTTTGAGIGAERWSSVELLYDGAQLQLRVDGAVRGEMALDGALVLQPGAGLVLGGAQGEGFAGGLRTLDLDATADLAMDALPETFQFEANRSTEFLTAFCDGDLILGENATLSTDGDGAVLCLSDNGWADLGKIGNTAQSSALAVTTMFTLDPSDSDGIRAKIFETPSRLSVEILNDRFKVSVGLADGTMERVFSERIDGLFEPGTHQVTVWVDAEADALRLTLDGAEIMTLEEFDIDLAAAGRDRGWYLGSRWGSSDRDVEIHSFSIADFSDQHDWVDEPFIQDVPVL